MTRTLRKPQRSRKSLTKTSWPWLSSGRNSVHELSSAVPTSKNQHLVHARHERGYEFPRGREAIGADDVMDDRHADHGIEFRQGKKVFRADERPDGRHALRPIVEP